MITKAEVGDAIIYTIPPISNGIIALKSIKTFSLANFITSPHRSKKCTFPERVKKLFFSPTYNLKMAVFLHFFVGLETDKKVRKSTHFRTFLLIRYSHISVRTCSVIECALRHPTHFRSFFYGYFLHFPFLVYFMKICR